MTKQQENQAPSAKVTLGYTIFYVNSVRSTLDFYMTAFGLQERLITPEGDYGELDTGSTVLSFASNALAESNLSSAGGFVRLDPTSPPPGISITLLTADVPAMAQAALEAGARAYGGPVDKPWGQTVAYVLDPNGVLVEIATPIAT